MYPLLKGLLKEGLVRATPSKGKGVSRTYALTQKGSRELAETRRLIAGAGRKEPVMTRLFSELLPGSVLVPMMVRRFREEVDVLREKATEIPAQERETLLRELRLVLASQIDWIDSQLPPARAERTEPKRQL